MPASDRSSELRIPTKTVAVRLALVGSLPTHADMFVPAVQRRGHSQLFDDLTKQLCSETTFIPVGWSNRVRLVGKHAIAWIAVRRQSSDEIPSPDLSGEPSELTLYDREHSVELQLVDGTKLIGAMLDSAPADRPRLIDHLNRAGRFLRLWTSDEHYLVNALQVVAVTELAEAR